ncbi:kelch domain-containing protein 1 isoform X4 [Anguilla rostrata]|uniref:kelch domain-containing protein 1 isoform X4 n=1 Tax=Anguilla rostrata TaxID=7938 RepID=UPI0030D5CB52
MKCIIKTTHTSRTSSLSVRPPSASRHVFVPTAENNFMDSDSGPVSSYFQMDWAMDYTAGLVARERSGHTALLEGGFLYVWGGYVSIADDEVFLPNDEIWLYDIESGIWETHVMRGEVPPPMSGMCGSSLNGEMYVFGGCNEDGHTNQLYHVNLLDGKYTWRKVMNSSGAPPTPRDKLSCWVYKNRLIYFGGYGDKHFRQLNNSRSFVVDEALWVEEVFWGWNNEVHIFNPSTASWSEPHTHGLAPAPRAAHAGATLGSRGYVCGGRVMETRMSDIHCLDLESWTWTEMLWHTASLGKDSDVIVFGGSQDDILFVDKGHCNDALVFQTQPYTLLRLCEDYMGKNPWVLQDQLLWLPRKLKQIIIKRISFFKPTAKSQEIIHAT